ncbi:hypothetical protein LCGC14_0854340 [marine sediment metagenome]|uniref:Uncharacterized protein n=1 Tax=marine sediment metagenome TaxID=412755 RepID=A0A0F9SGE9_9ZZZZ
MRASRVFRLIFRIFILILTTSVTLVTVLGGLSAVLILDPTSENIGIDTDEVDFNIDIDLLGGVVNEFNFTLPFNITNAGYFDLHDLEMRFVMGVRYEHINLTVPGQNDTVTAKIFEKTHIYGTILKGATENYVFKGNFTDFISVNFPDLQTEVNWYRSPQPALEFVANFTVSLVYSLGLHVLAFGGTNQSIGDFSLP